MTVQDTPAPGGVSFIVLGDLIADVTYYGDCTRLSPEDGRVPVFEPRLRTVVAGGAGRVVRQLSALTQGRTLYGGLAAGEYADGVVASLTRPPFPSLCLTRRDHFDMPTKFRFVTEAGLAFRYDLAFPNRLYTDGLPALLGQDPRSAVTAALIDNAPRGVTLVLSDYGKGCFKSHFWEATIAEACRRRCLVVYDWPGDGFESPFVDIKAAGDIIIKMNLTAAKALVKRDLSARDDAGDLFDRWQGDQTFPHRRVLRRDRMGEFARGLYRMVTARTGLPGVLAVVVTAGPDGAFVVGLDPADPDRVVIETVPSGERHLPGNPCGAGDVFTAVLACALGEMPCQRTLNDVFRAACVGCHLASYFASRPGEMLADRTLYDVQAGHLLQAR